MTGTGQIDLGYDEGWRQQQIAIEKLKMRTDSHRNPTAFTVDIAHQGGLIEGKDFSIGDSFRTGPNDLLQYTARLLGDPIALTIQVIDKIGFYTHTGAKRWEYIGMPMEVWRILTTAMKQAVIGGMYCREIGHDMMNLFPYIYRF